MAFPLLLSRYKSLEGGAAESLITYLLRDEFTTDLAAGAVNGTLAEPGPGTRTVVDTNSIISIASGVLTVNGTPAVSDRYYLDGMTRTAGRILIGKLIDTTSMGTTYSVRFGWSDTSGAGSTMYPGFGFSSDGTSIRCLEGTTNMNTVTGVSDPVIMAAVLRASGGYYFLKIGGTWNIYWISGTNATATMYPKLVATSAAAAANFTADSFRVPDVLWLPTPLAYDTFTRANGALGNSETTGPDSQAVTARAWTDQIGTWAIASNVAVCTALAGGIGIATVPAGSANALVDAALTRGTGTAGVVCRYAADNYIYAIHNGTNAQLVKVVGGSPTTLINAAATYSAGAVIRVILDGSSVSLFYNNSQVGTTQTVSDAGILNNTAHGLYSTDTDSTLNNFLVFPRGNGGEYAALDTYSA